MIFPTNDAVMRRALELAARGIGMVEPNPPVGAVLVDDDRRLIAEGWHQQFGEPHAEVHALRDAGERARGATLFVTLEPCCHFGKTPPCSRAVIAAGVKRVVVARQDPAPHVDGGGIAELQQAGIAVEVGLLEEPARRLTAPFAKLMTRGRPWVHAKWAMTLDGKLATRTGHSQWISNDASRARVHALRGRMDAIVVGIGTALADDPLLTARPPGPRNALRVVIDSRARLPVDSQLFRTAAEHAVLVVAAEDAPPQNVEGLRAAGVEVLLRPRDKDGHLPASGWLEELGRRRLTHLLVEGGSRLLGQLFDADEIDEVHAFVAPKLAGGAGAPSPLAGMGRDEIPRDGLYDASVEMFDSDVYLHGYCRRA